MPRRISKIAVESRDLFNDSGDENDSFLLQMETGCAAILARMSHSADADAAALVTSGSIRETIARMRQSIEEIRKIEIQMFRVAMNARINANHQGRAGDPLDVLADSMGQQAFESRQRSESLIKDLDSMRIAATRLSEQIEPDTPGGSDSHGEYSEVMRTAIAGLHASRERSSARIPQVIACAGRLREDLSATIAGFTAGVLFAEGVSRARTMIDEIGRASGLSPDGKTPERTLADFPVHYTMQSERDVHESIMATSAGVPGAAARRPPEPKAEDEAELGENVEFF
jgi:hypothetical protein